MIYKADVGINLKMHSVSFFDILNLYMMSGSIHPQKG